jgi:diguanylate cyclase (GGDEF)-like protein/PAS domain S-box-containing protein
MHHASGWRRLLTTVLGALLLVALAAPAAPIPTELRVVVAYSVANSGLVTVLANDFRASHPETNVRIIPTGALDAVTLARRGEADLVITHHRPSEDLLVEEGYGLRRTELLYDEFAIFGPAKDPLQLAKEADLIPALKRLARNKVRFFTPAVESGAHKKLNELWELAGVKPDWVGYENTGASSASTLKQAALFGAYTLTDMATYLANRHNLQGNIAVLYQNHPSLRNTYSAIVVSQQRVPGAHQAAAEEFLDYLVSGRGQGLMQRYGDIKYGEKLYTPVAHLDPNVVVARVGDKLKKKTLFLNLMLVLVAILVALILMVLHLVSRFRRAERARRETEERFMLAVSGTNDAIWDWNIETDEAYYSSRWKEMLGYVGYDVEIGNDIQEWISRIHPEDRELTLSLLDNYLNGRSSSFCSEHRLRTKRGNYIWVLDKGKILWDKTGKPIRMSGSVTDIHERKLQIDVMEHQTLHDLITDLPNRALFMDRLQQALLVAQRDKLPLMVLVTNLNRFREINDTLGQDIGNLTLTEVATRLRATLRLSDTIARSGGDEFAILLRSPDDTDTAARRILKALAEPMMLKGNSVSISASMGIAIFPQHAETADDLLQRASVAMYTAKHSHSDYAVYTPLPVSGKQPTHLSIARRR